MATIVKITNRRRNRKKTEYLAMRSDFTKTWATAKELKCPELIQKFENELGAHFHPVCKFKNGRRPLRILGGCELSGHLIFIMEFLGTEQVQFVMAETVYMLCPDIAINFYAKNSDWGPEYKKEEDPYEVSFTTTQVFLYLAIACVIFGKKLWD